VSQRGIFITFEGPEGAGKSTQIANLHDYLVQQCGRSVVVTREPGGTPLAEEFRQILKHHNTAEPIYPLTEVLLFLAGRVQNVRQNIAPALDVGKVVLCDRFMDSTLAYQGYARMLDVEKIRQLNQTIMGNVKVDLTILLDLPVEAGFARTGKRAETKGNFDRLEAENIAFHQRVRQGFLAIAEQEPERVKVFDAQLSAEELTLQIIQAVNHVLR